MNVQHSTHFPTESWQFVLENKEVLSQLADKWKWFTEDLVYCDIEAPVKVKERLENDGIYRPKIKVKNLATMKKQKLIDLGMLQEGGTVNDLFNDGEMIHPLAGETVMEVPAVWRARRQRGLFSQRVEEDARSGPGSGRKLTEEDVVEIEIELEDLAKDILTEWDRRQQQSNLEKAAFKAFSTKFDWKDDLHSVLEHGMSAVVQADHTETMKDLLKNILQELPTYIAEKFDIDVMLDGFTSFLKLSTKMERLNLSSSKIYEAWYKEKVSCENSTSSDSMFSNMLQNIQIRTSSEAMAETVGSIMSNHCGKGRYLDPVNFNKEIFLEFNLGPSFMMQDLAKEIFLLKKKKYIYNQKADGSLVTHFSRLADTEEGSSIKTYRKKQIEKSHLPVSFWEK